MYACTSTNKQLLLPKCTTGPHACPTWPLVPHRDCSRPEVQLLPHIKARMLGSTCGLVRDPKSARRSQPQGGEAPIVAALFDQSHASPSLLQLQAQEWLRSSTDIPWRTMLRPTPRAYVLTSLSYRRHKRSKSGTFTRTRTHVDVGNPALSITVYTRTTAVLFSQRPHT